MNYYAESHQTTRYCWRTYSKLVRDSFTSVRNEADLAQDTLA
jgi:hypothetical protein